MTEKNNLQKSLWLTVVASLLKNAGHSPKRAARNICELSKGVYPFTYEELVSLFSNHTPEEWAVFFNGCEEKQNHRP